MFKFEGVNLNGTVTSDQYTLPMVIKNHQIVNKSGGNVNVNVYLITESGNVSIAPYPIQLTATQMYQNDYELLMNINEQVRLVTNGNVDYIFNIDNAEAP